jgi:hypothetical protein
LAVRGATWAAKHAVAESHRRHCRKSLSRGSMRAIAWAHPSLERQTPGVCTRVLCVCAHPEGVAASSSGIGMPTRIVERVAPPLSASSLSTAVQRHRSCSALRRAGQKEISIGKKQVEMGFLPGDVVLSRVISSLPGVVRAGFVAAGASPQAATGAAYQTVMDEASVDYSDVARGHNFAMSLEHEVRPQLPPKSEAVVFGR